MLSVFVRQAGFCGRCARRSVSAVNAGRRTGHGDPVLRSPSDRYGPRRKSEMSLSCHPPLSEGVVHRRCLAAVRVALYSHILIRSQLDISWQI